MMSPNMRRARLPHAMSLLEVNVQRSAHCHYNSGLILQFFQAEQRPFPVSCLQAPKKQWLF